MSRQEYFTRWLASIGIVPDLILRRAQVRALTTEDYRELREDFGASEQMIAELQRLVADSTDTRDVWVLFAQGIVQPSDEGTNSARDSGRL